MTENRSVVACGQEKGMGRDSWMTRDICGFKGACICQNSSNSIYRVLIIPQQSCKIYFGDNGRNLKID